ncbi:DUF6476 family protein [Meridianimarinicoccus marinus]
MVDNSDAAGPEPANLRFLRILVSVLTAVMILGIVTIIGLMIWKFSGETAPSLPDVVTLPDTVTLPDGTVPMAVTVGAAWYAVVTAQDEILIFDKATGTLRQQVKITVEAQ